MTRFAFTIAATDGAARTGTIAMQRGEIRTPAFMPVGTAATVKAMKPADVRASGADLNAEDAGVAVQAANVVVADNQLQDVLNGRKRKFPTRQKAIEDLAHRGFLECKQCGSKRTGSASKGNGGKYFYYHCQHGCKERFKAEGANEELIKEFAKISANSTVIRILKESLDAHLRLSKSDKQDQKEKLQSEIEKAKSRIANARRLMLDKEIEATEYKEIKTEYEGEIEKLERKIDELTTLDSDLKEHIAFCCDLLEGLPKYFTAADLTGKQQILGSILSEKLVFSENGYRTIKFRKVVSLICRRGKDYKVDRKKESPENSELSNVVPRTGIEPAHP